MTAEFDMYAPLLERESVTSPTQSSSQDEVLVKAAQSGDRNAFGQLYARYVRMVHGILLTRVPFPLVEDMVQDVFVQALPRLGTLRDGVLQEQKPIHPIRVKCLSILLSPVPVAFAFLPHWRSKTARPIGAAL